MRNNNVLKQTIALMIALTMLLVSGAVLAQPDADTSQHPVYLDIHPVADAQHSSLSDDLIASMARDKLSALGRPVRSTSDEMPPLHVYVLRILYIVQPEPRRKKFALAASASTELLYTDDKDDDGVVQTYSLYNGLQQVLVQGVDEKTAIEKLRDSFKRQLRARIALAFVNIPSP